MVVARALQSAALLTVAIGIDGWTLSRTTTTQQIPSLSLSKVPRESESSLLHETTFDVDGSVVSSWLVCGDGDLSYSARIAPLLNLFNVSLTATVLEDRATHHSVYSNSNRNADAILTQNLSSVRFGIDATRLEHHFPAQHFDGIQFNFPHWRGKANNRRNRDLLQAFFASAAQVLSPHGEVQVALCQGQGGSHACTMRQWKGSWMAAMYAAEHGMMLHAINDYIPEYNLSSHRGVDRPFHAGEKPRLYRFRFPNNTPIDRRLQLCCRHELHICLPISPASITSWNADDVMYGDAIQQFAQTWVVPEGIQVDVPLRVTRNTSEYDTMIVFLLVYRAESRPLTRLSVDSYRAKLESEIGKVLNLRSSRVGRLVSKPFPYTTLDAVIEETKNAEG